MVEIDFFKVHLKILICYYSFTVGKVTRFFYFLCVDNPKGVRLFESNFILWSKTCFERPLKFSMKIGRKRQVALQKRGKINMKSKEFDKS